VHFSPGVKQVISSPANIVDDHNIIDSTNVIIFFIKLYGIHLNKLCVTNYV